MPISETIAIISGMIALGKQVKAASDTYNDAELKLQVAELVSRLADVQMALADTQKEIDSKDAEIASLVKAFQKREDTIEVGGLLYRMDENGDATGRPYCPNCMADGLAILIQSNGRTWHDNFCPTCKVEYHDARNR